MSIKWVIQQMERQTSDGLVTTVHWLASNSETVGEKVYSATSYGSIGLTAGSAMIPFDDLTEEVVINWVKDSLGEEQVTSIESGLAAQIASQKAPVSVSGFPEAWTAE